MTKNHPRNPDKGILKNRSEMTLRKIHELLGPMLEKIGDQPATLTLHFETKGDFVVRKKT